MPNNEPVIIFDFGNIIFDLDYDACFSNFATIFKEDWGGGNIPVQIQNVMERLEKGEISEEAFIWSFQQYNKTVNPRDIVDAWNSLLLQIPASRFEFLDQMNSNYRFALLSNINAIHEKYIHNYLKEEYGIIDFETRYFNKTYYSHHIKMRKPDEEIYQYVACDLDVMPSQILFIDDLPENVEAAKSCGWNAVVHNPKERIEEKFKHYLQTVM